MEKRVLILEDDRNLAMFLERGLRGEGHDVRLESDGDQGLRRGLEEAFDLIVLDLSLPGRDGIEVLKGLSKEGVDTSVLVLSGRNSVADRILCFDLGADDFLPKPFSFAELLARCRALLRRREHFSDPLLRAGDLELHRTARRVTCGGQTVELTTKEFALLEHLMRARGRTCSRSELLKEVWQMSPGVGTNVVDVYINYLRKKLAATRAYQGEGGDRVIDTVRGEGYCLTPSTIARQRGPRRAQENLLRCIANTLDQSPPSLMLAGHASA